MRVNSAERLVAAMHTAGGNVFRQVAVWLTLAQIDDDLRAAFRSVFGNRLPTPGHLGNWLSKHTGTVGKLTLIGQHSTHHKAWRYRVVDVAAEKAAFAAKEVERAKAAPPPPKVAPAPVLPVNDPVLNPYMSASTVHSDGRVTREAVLGRDGQPLKAIPVAPEPASEISSGQSDGRPPWLQRGERKPRDRAEWQEWQRGRSGAPSVGGFANPGGIVSHNIIVEDGNVLNYCHVAGVWPGGQR